MRGHDVLLTGMAVRNNNSKYLSIQNVYSMRAWLRCACECRKQRGSTAKAFSVTLPPFQTLYFEDLSIGMTETYAKTVKSSDVVGFAEITGDRNPIHLSEHFAAKTPFKNRIAHGLYTASLISAVIGTRLPGPGAIYISQTLNFLSPVKIGDTVEATVEVLELVVERQRARLSCVCRVGDVAVLKGEAWVKIPRRGEAETEKNA